MVACDGPQKPADKNPASTDLNNTKMRAWVKAIAIVTGLGLYIFAGEDMLEKSKEEQEKEEEEAYDCACSFGKDSRNRLSFWVAGSNASRAD